MTESDVSADIRSSLRRWRSRLLLQRSLSCLAIATLIWLLARLTGIHSGLLLQLYALMLIVGFGHLLVSHKWRLLNTHNFLLHLNRRFAAFEESAQLLIRPESDLSGIQKLQHQRVVSVYSDRLSQVRRWQPPVNFKLPLTVVVICLALSFYTVELRSLLKDISQTSSRVHTNELEDVSETGLNFVAVYITPPSYTGLKATETNTLDLEIPQGSQVRWRLSFKDNEQTYTLVLGNDQHLPLTAEDDGFWEASARVEKTGLYRIVQREADELRQVGGIHSITVALDRSPDIRMLEPDVSTLELSKDGSARFVSRALIHDDFGIETVEILASVAKGSGESVKFRDQTLQFDQSSSTDKGELYQRDWNLKELGMEPGDELYFTVLATDNKKPQANTGRSATLIVRWLDDETAVLAADGMAIDFIPEFFKSQRQIIIDTEQLLEDQQQLESQEFKDQSYSIGHSQADLKQKYGQYLGDEFEEGPAEQFGETHESDDGDDHHDDEHSESSFSDNTKITSTADILNRYGHNHGDPEIGPITRRNPLALMKRAVSEMWQAERHLMQAEPEQALPYEYEAYKYLKLARQADRIYVKRLGFVPPPVSEETRLTGDLDDILSYNSETGNVVLDPSGHRYTQGLLHDIYQFVTGYSSEILLSDEQRQQLRQFNQLLTLWSAQNPDLIRHAVTVETLLLSGRIDANCKQCMQNLASVVWSLIDGDSVDFRQRRASWQTTDTMLNDYQQTLIGGEQ